MPNILIEVGCEELPPTSLQSLSDAFTLSIEAQLREQRIDVEWVQAFSSPRRLAVFLKNAATHTPAETLTHWGPPARIAFDDAGQPTKAATAFAAKLGLNADALSVSNDGKADKITAQTQAGNEAVTDLLPEILKQVLAGLPIAKRMRWGNKRFEFVRPVHWLVVLSDSDVVQAEVMGVHSGRVTYGHRVYAPKAIELAHADEYQETLYQAHVMVDASARRQRIVEQIERCAASKSLTAIIDDDLLDEIVGLVEWPVALMGQFDARFLSVPAEALISSMKSHQKYVHLTDPHGALAPYFITVANIDSDEPERVIRGNERVIRPRLSDADFFYTTDKKQSLTQHRVKLKTVTFQHKLGSVYDKSERVQALAQYIAKSLDLPATDAVRAASLAKSDLATELVGEFADLQGIAGQYYAINDGETDTVAQAIREHYLPRFASDALPETDAGAIVAMADRLDTLVGIFGIGQQPTGSKDPFALRRASVGLVRLLVEQTRDIDLHDVLNQAKAGFSVELNEDTVQQCQAYIIERMRTWFEEQGIRAEVFQAVVNLGLSHPLDIAQRVRAVDAFSRQPEAIALAAANKRVSNLLSKVDDPGELSLKADKLEAPAEKVLFKALNEQTSALASANGDYQAILRSLCTLREPVDTFFDEVMVMCDDESLKHNRLALLQALRSLFLQVADIATLSVSKVSS